MQSFISYIPKVMEGSGLKVFVTAAWYGRLYGNFLMAGPAFLSQFRIITSDKILLNKTKIIQTNRWIPGYCLSTPHRSSLSIQHPPACSSHQLVWAWRREEPPQAYHDGIHNKVLLPCWSCTIHLLPNTVPARDTLPTWRSNGKPGVQCICPQMLMNAMTTSTQMMCQEKSLTGKQQKSSKISQCPGCISQQSLCVRDVQISTTMGRHLPTNHWSSCPCWIEYIWLCTNWWGDGKKV